jgi:hypothetical protein
MAVTQNSMCDYVLKGRGFQPRREALKFNSGLSRRGRRSANKYQTRQKEGHHE